MTYEKSLPVRDQTRDLFHFATTRKPHYVFSSSVKDVKYTSYNWFLWHTCAELVKLDHNFHIWGKLKNVILFKNIFPSATRSTLCCIEFEVWKFDFYYCCERMRNAESKLFIQFFSFNCCRRTGFRLLRNFFSHCFLLCHKNEKLILNKNFKLKDIKNID
jgi:hypothetical protein